jgi:glycosyltransferase involved in cell wall biosynthesis
VKKVVVGLVVPSLEQGGGVLSVAEFVYQTMLKNGRFEPRLVSLSTSAIDDLSVAVTKPSTWFKGIRTSKDLWRDRTYTRVGSFASELEFQRYRPRIGLSQLLADCDLIQVVCGSPAWANTVVGFGKPVALQVATRARVERRLRDANPQNLSGWWCKVMTEITDRMDDRGLCKVDAIQVENMWMLEYARKINGKRDVDLRYAPPGIDSELFSPLEHRDLNSDQYILCVGRLDDPRKNVALLLNAYAQLSQELRAQVRLVLAGFSGPSENFWLRAEALGVRERINYVARPSTIELVHLYQRASVFALSSDEEGLGVVLLEAMACGVPVVATRCGGPDGIITDGEDSYLVPPNDLSRMTARIESLLRNPALNLQMGQKARLKIERRYDERIAGAVFIDMWERLVHKTRVPR